MKKYLILYLSLVIVALPTFAQSADVKIKDVAATDDTTISIRKGPHADDKKTYYEIVSGTDEISSDDEMDDRKALAGWKSACAEWKKEMRELNSKSDSSLLVISCGSKVKVFEKSRYTYKSMASYKLRVKIKE